MQAVAWGNYPGGDVLTNDDSLRRRRFHIAGSEFGSRHLATRTSPTTWLVQPVLNVGTPGALGEVHYRDDDTYTAKALDGHYRGTAPTLLDALYLLIR